MAEQEYDVVILGGGSGGYAAALRASELGLSVALVEKDKLGGTCLHRGCIPTKALLHAAEIADATRESETFGVRATLEGIDVPAVTKYREGVVGRLYKGLQGLVKSRKITYVEGTGRLADAHTVEVDGQRLRGTNVVLATGSYARTLPGLEIGGRILTSDGALALDHVPEKVVVLGGGVIGVEFASVWRSFGVDVTIVEALPRLVAAEDEADLQGLRAGVPQARHRLQDRRPLLRRHAGRRGVTVSLESGEELRADYLLVAVGRGPVTEGLGLRGGRRDGRPRLRADRRAAAHRRRGRVRRRRHRPRPAAGPPRLRRTASSWPRRSRASDPAVVVDVNVPRVTYSDPEIGSVGLTEAQAKEKLGADNVESYEYNLGGNGKSQIIGTAGFVKLVREKDGPVVGVHTVGARMGEQIGEAQLIVNWEAYPEDVAALVHAHPTQNEAMGEAHLALAGKPLHAHS